MVFRELYCVDLRNFWDKYDCLYDGRHVFREKYYLDFIKLSAKYDWLHEGEHVFREQYYVVLRKFRIRKIGCARDRIV